MNGLEGAEETENVSEDIQKCVEDILRATEQMVTDQEISDYCMNFDLSKLQPDNSLRNHINGKLVDETETSQLPASEEQVDPKHSLVGTSHSLHGNSSGYNSAEESFTLPASTSTASSTEKDGNQNDDGLGSCSTPSTRSEHQERNADHDDLILPLEQMGSITYAKLSGSPVLKNVISSEEPVDTIISCMNGKIGAHRLVLIAASPFLGYLMKGQKLGETATIILPDVELEVMEIILQLCYGGETHFPKSLEDKLFDALQDLRIGENLGETTFSLYKLNANVNESEENVREVESSQQDDEKISADSEAPGPSPSPSAPSPRTSLVSNHSNSSSTISTCSSSSFELSSSCKKTKPDPMPQAPSKNTNHKLQLKQTPVLGIDFTGLAKGCHECWLCHQELKSKGAFIKHLELRHKTRFCTSALSQEESKVLRCCEFCNKQFGKIDDAKRCLKSHGFQKCYLCFGVFKKTEVLSHREEAHGLHSPKGLVMSCRWCDLAFPINSENVASRHAVFSHFHFENFATVSSAPNSPMPKNLSPGSNGTQTNTLLSYITKVKSGSASAPEENEQQSTSNGDCCEKPIQVAKRTGQSNRLLRRVVKPGMQYHNGPYNIPAEKYDARTKSLKININEIPKTYVLIEDMLATLEDLNSKFQSKKVRRKDVDVSNKHKDQNNSPSKSDIKIADSKNTNSNCVSNLIENALFGFSMSSDPPGLSSESSDTSNLSENRRPLVDKDYQNAETQELTVENMDTT